jgi:hypothetical protein
MNGWNLHIEVTGFPQKLSAMPSGSIIGSHSAFAMSGTCLLSAVSPCPWRIPIFGTNPGNSRFSYDQEMRDLVFLFIHVITTGPTPGSGRPPFRCRRDSSRQTATPDRQSFPAEVTQSPNCRSTCCGFVCSPHPPRTPDPFSDRAETFLWPRLARAPWIRS